MMPMMFRYIHEVFVVRPCQRFFRVMPPLQMSCTYLSLFPETKQDRGVLIIISNNSSYVLFIACDLWKLFVSSDHEKEFNEEVFWPVCKNPFKLDVYI